MTTQEKILWIAGTAAVLFFVLGPGKDFLNILKSFLSDEERFSAVPYWDVSRWSWGYGTRVPDSIDNKNMRPTGTITREQAWSDAQKHILSDYDYLKPLVKVNLNANQWAALLSFSYNEGPGNADNLVKNINDLNWPALEDEWNLYIYADNQINQDLIDRRAKEWYLFAS